MERISDIMMSLIRSEIRGETAENIPEDMLSDGFFAELYKLSKYHDMAHIVGSALATSGQLPKNEIGKKFEKQTFAAVFRYERLNYEYGQICRVLEETGIVYVPLKGSVVRAYYPKPWMRTSCDIDILVHEEDLQRASEAICSSLGYKSDEEEHIHDISLFSDSGIHLELHFSILEARENIDKMLARVWEFCLAETEGGYKYLQTDEYFVFHHIAHMYYHFVKGGCGIKPFADLTLLLDRMDFDSDVVESYCDVCGIGRFWDSVKKLSRVWFGGDEHTELTSQMERYLLSGGVYGTKRNVIVVNQMRRGGKIKYTLSRLWIKFDHLKSIYPSVEKHRWLTPVYQMRRWFNVLFGGRLGESVKELKTSGQVSDAESESVESMMKNLGI